MRWLKMAAGVAAWAGLGLAGCATAMPAAAAGPPAAEPAPVNADAGWDRYRDEGAAGQGCKVEPEPEDDQPEPPPAKCKRELPPAP